MTRYWTEDWRLHISQVNSTYSSPYCRLPDWRIWVMLLAGCSVWSGWVWWGISAQSWCHCLCHAHTVICHLTFRYRGWALMGVGPMEKMVASSSSSSIVVFIIMEVFSGEVLHIRFIMRQHATSEHIYLWCSVVLFISTTVSSKNFGKL